MSSAAPPAPDSLTARTNLIIPVAGLASSSAITQFIKQWFLFLYFLTGMAAYSIGGVPVSWIAQAGFIALAAGLIFFTDRIRIFPGTVLMCLFLVWAVVISTVHLNEYSGAMPPMVTMPYWAYVSFRYLNIIAFLSALYIAHWLVLEGEGEALVRGIVTISVIICAMSIYIYFAHIFNLPEPPRNRAGTSGLKQSTTFSSSGFNYSRATGTFREPSGLAEWLMLPFFLSFSFKEKADKIRSAIISGTIILTVSMMGVFSIAAGAGIGFILTRPFSKRTFKILLWTILIGGVVFFALSQITIGTLGDKTVSLATVLGNRIVITLFGGVSGSNRSYVYDFVAENPFPPLGMGFGNGNLEFSAVTGNDVIASFLSLYLFTLYAVGYPGMAVLAIFLLRPIVQFVAGFRKNLEVTPLVLMAYVGYLISSAVGAEELSPWFGITAGLLACEARRLSWAKRYFRQRPLKPADA